MQSKSADVLKKRGLSGKWHLGYLPQFHPLSRGFHDYFGVLAGGSIFIDQSRPGVESIGNWPRQRDRLKGVYDGTALVQVDELADAFTNRATQFIENKRTIFFIRAITPHGCRCRRQKYLDRYRHIENPAARIYAAMVPLSDDSVGAVIRALQATNQLEPAHWWCFPVTTAARVMLKSAQMPRFPVLSDITMRAEFVYLIFSWPDSLNRAAIKTW